MLEVQDLSVNYRGVQALREICFQLSGGKIAGLIGPNGAGKSTLLKSMLGLVPIQAGKVLYQGCPLKQQRRQVAYVPQRSHIDWDYPITVWNVVMMGRTAHTGWFQGYSRQSKEIAKQALERVELTNLAHRQIGELSGGQQQRVFLARALAQQADLFLLDEPLTGVDKKTEALILEIYEELKAEGKTLLVSCHEWGETLEQYDRLLLINQDLIANDIPTAVMTPENIQKAYGTNLNLKRSPQHLETMFFC
ncbi:metal ABC transporter ATP-binding protein [Merismopedia glauca]|uniref:Manganese ABC transporter ATP-binding protein n=1 Tax=Merismopedia glauca CCAP 1448/3 TaxID=1296344 RepID=A0A2T1C7L2_9CYAN|nr:metal ABC transporter ATP-binding protein [Merismopedia glauca]PSB04250.1 manganese ABC transporter ATP-binding protein [Merismopedia glauca CCAP 1448/3]